MPKPRPKDLSVRELRSQLSRVVEDVAFRGASYVVTFHGRPRCAIVPLEDVETATPAPSPATKGSKKKARRVPRE